MTQIKSNLYYSQIINKNYNKEYDSKQTRPRTPLSALYIMITMGSTRGLP